MNNLNRLKENCNAKNQSVFSSVFLLPFPRAANKYTYLHSPTGIKLKVPVINKDTAYAFVKAQVDFGPAHQHKGTQTLRRLVVSKAKSLAPKN